MINLPTKIEYVINTLQKNGYEAFIVGGCVRDSLMGLTPHDFDVTTSAKPETVMELFEKTVPTGIKHGTVTVIVEKTPIEVTTFRTEGGYSDNRHPENVNFVSNIKEDLSRRDFTVNAIAYNPRDEIVDFFNGCEDIKNRVLRAVGEPKKRFEEDALRILRLIRFSSVLEFTCEQNTFNSALECAKNLESISKERIFTELYKASYGKNFNVIEPVIKGGYLKFLKIDTVPDFEKISPTTSPDLAFFTFLHFASCDLFETLKILKVSNKLKNYCKSVKELLNIDSFKTKADIKRILLKYEKTAVSDALTLKGILEKRSYEKELTLLEEIFAKSEPYLISHLALSGDDLKKLGFSGKKTGDALAFLQNAVIENPCLNQKENLIKKLNEFSA